jgi:hypothetical protein
MTGVSHSGRVFGVVGVDEEEPVLDPAERVSKLV